MILDHGKLNIASLAPSFPVYFDCHPLQLVTALKLAGFDYVEETVVVLPEILALRQRYAAKSTQPLLSESCPKVVQMICENYPHLIEQIAPVPSPMELHGRKLKEKYGPDCQTFFFSPCIHKQVENRIKKAMDQVVTFHDLQGFLERMVDQPFHRLEKSKFDSKLTVREARLGVLAMSVHGPDACERFLQQFSTDARKSFYEVLYCEGGCAQTAQREGPQRESPVEKILKVWEAYA